LEDAQSARDALARAGIAAHIADRIVADMIRVQVDNRWLDHARRAIRAWLNGSPRDIH
jgi:hypothetical protein